MFLSCCWPLLPSSDTHSCSNLVCMLLLKLSTILVGTIKVIMRRCKYFLLSHVCTAGLGGSLASRLVYCTFEVTAAVRFRLPTDTSSPFKRRCGTEGYSPELPSLSVGLRGTPPSSPSLSVGLRGTHPPYLWDCGYSPSCLWDCGYSPSCLWDCGYSPPPPPPPPPPQTLRMTLIPCAHYTELS